MNNRSIDFLEEAVRMKEGIKYWEREMMKAQQLLKDAVSVMNAHSVGYKTQEEIEKFLERNLW